MHTKITQQRQNSPKSSELSALLTVPPGPGPGLLGTWQGGGVEGGPRGLGETATSVDDAGT